MTVTMKGLARLAGTSTSTVSRALAGSPLVAEATRRRIERLAQAHRYSPNAIAQGLVNKRTRLIGLLVPDITNPFFSEWAHAVEAEATRFGYPVVLCNTMRNPAQEDVHIRTLTQLRVAGMVVISLDTRNPSVQRLAGGRVPVVFCQPPGFTSTPVDIVSAADRQGARVATAHLIAVGRRTLAHLAGSEDAPATELRRDGFRLALEEAGLAYEPSAVEVTTYSEVGGYEGTLRLMERRPATDAIFAANDLIAIGAILALQHIGRRVPEDVAVVGMDDIRLASLLRPGLTTVRMPADRIAREATAALIERLENPEREPRIVEIPPVLVVRESSGAAPEGGDPRG